MFDLCHDCHKPTKKLLPFNEVIGVKPCAVTRDDWRVYNSLEPVYVNAYDLCYPCFRAAVRKYVAVTRAN